MLICRPIASKQQRMSKDSLYRRTRRAAFRLLIALAAFSLAYCAPTPALRIPSDMPTDLKQEIGNLRSPYAAVRGSAAIRLGIMRTRAEPAIPFLVELLGDNAPYEKPLDGEIGYPGIEAAKALAKLGAPAAKPLLVVLKDKDASVREDAALALGEMKEISAVNPLVETLKDDNPGVRAQAAEALGKIKSFEAIEPLIAALPDKHPSVLVAAAWALGELKDSRAVEPLAMMLRHQKDEVRRVASSALAEIAWEHAWNLKGTTILDALIEALKSDEDSLVRKNAAMALGYIADHKALVPLLHSLSDEDPNVRWNVISALGEIPNSSSVNPIIKALGDQHPEVRSTAAWALGAIRDKRAILPLVATLTDPIPHVRAKTAEALGELKAEEAVPYLAACISDTDPIVRKEALLSLEAITGVPAKIWIERWEHGIRPYFP